VHVPEPSPLLPVLVLTVVPAGGVPSVIANTLQHSTIFFQNKLLLLMLQCAHFTQQQQ
jgi:hypothetical protein